MVSLRSVHGGHRPHRSWRCRRSTRRRYAAFYSAGLIVSAGTMALAVTLVSILVRPAVVGNARAVAVAMAILISGWSASVLVGRGIPYPRSRWQVPEQWRFTMPLDITMLFYGVLLGVGFTTDVVLPAFWAFLLLAAAFASPATIFAGWALYAAARILVLVLWLWDDRDSLDSRFVPWRPGIARLSGATLLVTSFAVVQLFG